jgi:hypothetical protein
MFLAMAYLHQLGRKEQPNESKTSKVVPDKNRGPRKDPFNTSIVHGSSQSFVAGMSQGCCHDMLPRHLGAVARFEQTTYHSSMTAAALAGLYSSLGLA